MRFSVPTSTLLFVCLLATPSSATGQQTPDENQTSNPKAKLSRPELEQFKKAPYPENALKQEVEGEVVLILRIDAEGTVTEAKVEKGPGHGLNEAAREAALKFEFKPARRGETPIASRIRYRYQFELPTSAPEAEAKQKQGSSPESKPSQSKQNESSKAERQGAIRGKVLVPEGERPAVGAEVTIVGPDGDERSLTTDEDGVFRADDLPTGRYKIRARATSLGATSLTTEVLADQTTEITLRLKANDASKPIKVTVKGQSKEEKLQESARAVEVVDTGEAAKESGDMGEVLARQEGVGVRRTGGLGSGTRFSLNGLTDKQVRFFLDGVPLEFAGFPGGITNVPVNLIDRIDIYSGVVPIQLGADALGGAVNLVTTDLPEDNGARASYQFGSFNTHRATASGRLVDPSTGLYVRADGFFDYAENDYEVDVEVADDSGQISDATVPRFHDSYRSAGGGLEIGVAERDWAERLSLRLFGSDLSRDLQHNSVMTVPYGEVVWEQSVAGAVTRYEHHPTEETELDLAAGYNFTRRSLSDQSDCVYDWYGRCVNEQRRAGELGEFPSDRVIWEHAAFARMNGAWKPADNHTLRLSAAPTFVTRTGDERLEIAEGEHDPLSAQRDLFDFVTGLEYQVDLFDGRLQNIVFAKDYIQQTWTNEPLASGVIVDRDRTTHHFGYGDSLRYRFTDWLYGKASYEWATRLPTAEEIFGDAILIQPNLGLEPERSHNVNVELAIDDLETSFGSWRSQVTGFLRQADELIVLLGNTDALTYRNVLSARSIGAEVAAGWTSPGGVVAIDGNFTYVDLRNIANSGAFGDFTGDRIPNRPYLYANGTFRLQGDDMIVGGDNVSLTWRSRYVHSYFRGWESLGLTQYKQVIPAQLRHAVVLSHTMEGEQRALTTTFEVQNLTDSKMYDFFGVQQPGRAFYLKTTLEL